jgi:hypothetical protein
VELPTDQKIEGSGVTIDTFVSAWIILEFTLLMSLEWNSWQLKNCGWLLTDLKVVRHECDSVYSVMFPTTRVHEHVLVYSFVYSGTW